jgi:DeoR family fructose operon transcriptional repressor
MNHAWNARQQQIAQRLRVEGEVKISDLKEDLAVTDMTIRRDLEKLEAAGIAKRTFGGAIIMGSDVAITDRSAMRMEEKSRIGKLAVQLIRDGDSIFLDGGTTTLQVAKYMVPHAKITVVTNALNIATELLGKNIPTIVTGGVMLETTASLVGPMAVEAISQMAFDRVFLGATGIHHAHGFSNSNMYEAEIKKLAIQRAAEVNVVIDHSKFGLRELVSFASLSLVHRICTDRMPEDALLEACEEAGVEVMTGS